MRLWACGRKLRPHHKGLPAKIRESIIGTVSPDYSPIIAPIIPCPPIIPENAKPPKEQEADTFASELLIPMEQLKRFQEDLKSPDKLAGIFQVSRPAMAIAVANFFGSAKNGCCQIA